MTLWSEEVAGLDMGEDYAAAALVRRPRGGLPLRLLRLGAVRFAPAADDAARAAGIRKLWRRLRMPTATVAVSLRSRSVCMQYFSFASVAAGEFRSAISLEAEELLQMPPADIAFDAHLNDGIAVAGRDGGASCEGMLVAAPRKDVDRQMAILRRAGLYPVVMDVGPLALANLFAAVKGAPPAEGIGLLGLGRSLADVAFLFGSRRVYARSIYGRGGAWGEASGYLAESLSDMMKFYEFKLRRDPIVKLVCVGQIDHPLRDALAGRLAIPVEEWDVFRDLDLAGAPRRELRSSPAWGGEAAVSIGLGLRGDRDG